MTTAEHSAPPSSGTIDAAEVARFDRMAKTWWDATGPMRTLHKFNPVRIAYIRDQVALHFGLNGGPAMLDGLSVLDVGCGGGLLCEPLARLGAHVTGIDPATTNIAVASLHAKQSGLEIAYQSRTVEALAAAGEQFDVVLAMEVVEHVADVDLFMASCCQVVKPGGLLFLATLNRTVKAFALAIVGAEYVLGWLPRGTHTWSKFVKPPELDRALAAGGLSRVEFQGVSFDPLADRWRLTGDLGVNYMALATRPA